MMAELPLALFTTLAPVGAGAFIALAVAFFTTKFSDEQLKKIDRMTTIPVVVLVAGFICAFFHLASPMHAFGVFAGLGASPLSNELLAGVVFAVLAIVYWIVALAGKLGEGARKGFAAVVAVMADRVRVLHGRCLHDGDHRFLEHPDGSRCRAGLQPAGRRLPGRARAGAVRCA